VPPHLPKKKIKIKIKTETKKPKPFFPHRREFRMLFASS
jgi:hypothetical protein